VSLHVSTYSIALGFATVLIALVGVVAWRNRDRPGSGPFLVLLFGVGLWAFGNTVQLAATDLGTKLAFRTLAYVGHNLVPIAVLVFALAYTGRAGWLNRHRIGLLAAEPMAVALVLTPTNALGYHELVWTDVMLRDFGGLAVLGREFGPMYWVNTSYNYVLVMVAVYLFVQLVLESRHTGQKQGAALLAATIPPFLANVFWIGGLTAIDYTPFAFVITGLAFGFAMYRFRLFDVVPLAQETILDAIRDGYVVIDDRGRILDLNETARERMATATDPVGKPIEAVIPEIGTAPEAGTGEESAHEELVLERDAGPMYVDMEVTSLQGRPGKLLILRDVTAQRRVERRYRRLIENSSDLIAVLDDAGRFTYASPSWSDVLEHDPAAIVGENAFEYVHPEDREATWAEFERALEEPDYVATAEYRFERGDGSWVWLSSKGTNLFEDPFVEGFVVNTREITRRKRRERALEQQNQRLDEFTSAVSHDLRNPLNVIQGRLDLARETGDPDHFEAMENAATRMETLISDLLQLARQGQLVGETEVVSLATAAEEAWENIETRAATLDVEDGVVIEADPDRLYQLLENLFGNAVEHGGEAVSIRVGAHPEGFYVEDDGPGIPPEDRSTVFDRGYSTSEEGTGFGLSIVASIASAHGWSIEATAGDLGGARFEITGVERLPAPDED
jgi:PAS domain S-box-containing protein